MLQLLHVPTARTVRGLVSAVADAVRSVVAPASLVEQDAPGDVTAPDPAGLYEADELPDTDVIEAAAREFERAADQAAAPTAASAPRRRSTGSRPASTARGAFPAPRRPVRPRTSRNHQLQGQQPLPVR